jgi:hypothetical protein
MAAKNFQKHMANMARGYASLATRLAKKYAPGSRIRTTIFSKKIEQPSRGRYRIRVHAGGPDAPDARAREYGSGLWAKRGRRGTITIRPKGKALVFPWETPTSAFSGAQVHSGVPRTADGKKVILKKVEHPGVQAANNGRGYIGPAMRDTRKALRNRMKKEGTEAIKLDMRASFIKGGAIVK